MKESSVESAVCKYAKSKGWLPVKLSGPGDRGKPDRMFLRNGKAVFIEFKAPGKKPTALQLRWLEQLSDMGFVATWVDNVEEGMKFIGQLGDA